MNLQCGSSPGADIALHFNPRYDGDSCVVLNTFEYGSWAAEERENNSMLPAGSAFSLLITVGRDSYQVCRDKIVYCLKITITTLYSNPHVFKIISVCLCESTEDQFDFYFLCLYKKIYFVQKLFSSIHYLMSLYM